MYLTDLGQEAKCAKWPCNSVTQRFLLVREAALPSPAPSLELPILQFSGAS